MRRFLRLVCLLLCTIIRLVNTLHRCWVFKVLWLHRLHLSKSPRALFFERPKKLSIQDALWHESLGSLNLWIFCQYREMRDILVVILRDIDAIHRVPKLTLLISFFFFFVLAACFIILGRLEKMEAKFALELVSRCLTFLIRNLEIRRRYLVVNIFFSGTWNLINRTNAPLSFAQSLHIITKTHVISMTMTERRPLCFFKLYSKRTASERVTGNTEWFEVSCCDCFRTCLSSIHHYSERPPLLPLLLL